VVHQIGLGRLALERIVLDQQNGWLLHDFDPNKCLSNEVKITRFLREI
jgi:hypothetical protein